MISISNLVVQDNFSTSYVLVSWTLTPTTEDLGPYTFNLFRSTSPADADFSLLTSTDELSYVDDTVDLVKIAITYYYRVSITGPEGTVMQPVTATIYTERPDFAADTIVYSNNILLDVIDNPPILVVTRKRTGQQCPVCWDPVSRNVRKSNCTTCYSTGYTGGYNTPFSTKASFQTEGVQLSVDELAIAGQRLPTQGWVSNYPIINPEDLVVDHRNNRYKILSVQQTTKGRVLLRQIFQLQYLPATDIVYKFNVSGG